MCYVILYLITIVFIFFDCLLLAKQITFHSSKRNSHEQSQSLSRILVPYIGFTCMHLTS